MQIAIPSYKRSHLIDLLTIAYLKRCNVPMNLVNIFISGAEWEAYNKLNTGANLICVAADNVRDKFNAIHNYFGAGEEVLVIEDDIERIERLSGYNQTEETVALSVIAQEGFHLARKNSTKLWGISSNSNPFFLKDQAGPCFKLIIANMYGFIAEKPAIEITQHSKTDYERTILYTLKYGCVVRLDYLCPITKNYKNTGGMQEMSTDNRRMLEGDAVTYLTRKYPELCKRNEGKDSKFAEMSLKPFKVTPRTNNLFS